MRQSLWVLLLLLCYAACPARCQSMIPADPRDPVGQRLGWVPEKINEAIKQYGGYSYEGYILLGNRPGNLLAYKAEGGETLVYEIQNDIAVVAVISIPIISKEWRLQEAAIRTTCAVVGSAPEGIKYKGPYGTILIYKFKDTNTNEEVMCFRYLPPLEHN